MYPFENSNEAMTQSDDQSDDLKCDEVTASLGHYGHHGRPLNSNTSISYYWSIDMQKKMILQTATYALIATALERDLYCY